ncbi:hypothetical protein ESZ50_02305 [Weissella muntiaci]|uniref:Uncharacterized protein n=1 Tax=Weissella muntiaci TaxID=2508881 RepID=A0A6C2C908_9LACO|nr:hypothetical protein [Weissella muntiaci]TYC50520.1 hypothetical protein ESZ50_02305 [Weissella muntiaci]
MTKLEEDQRLARDKAKRKIQKFEDDFADYKKKFEAQFNQIHSTIQKLGISDDEMVRHEYNQQLEWHDERVRGAKKQLSELKDNYESLLRDQEKERANEE